MLQETHVKGQGILDIKQVKAKLFDSTTLVKVTSQVTEWVF